MMSSPILNELINKYRENKLAHAYLIETNNLEKALDDLREVIKRINCIEIYKDNCIKCNLCNLIDKNSLPSLKIIEPDGTSIKKTQIEELKESFATMPIYSKYNTYIIKNAEKLNSSSANAMLKFVEEPTDGILGFFLTNNKDVMIETIKSRCQTIVMNYESENIIETLEITKDKFENYTEIIKQYLSKIDTNDVINNKKELLSYYSERKDIENIMKIIFNIYYQNFLRKIGHDYDENLANFYKMQDNLETIKAKLNIINKILQEMSYNVSIELILDKFVIEMRGCNE